MSEDLVVGFTPVRAAQRVARWHGKIRSHLILLALAIIFAAVVLAWLRGHLPITGLLTLGLLVLIPLVLVTIDAVFFVVAKRDLASVGEGEALTAGRDGLGVRGTRVPWRDVRRIFTRPGGLLRSSLLVADTGLQQGNLCLP